MQTRNVMSQRIECAIGRPARNGWPSGAWQALLSGSQRLYQLFAFATWKAGDSPARSTPPLISFIATLFYLKLRFWRHATHRKIGASVKSNKLNFRLK
jgi:hypothetical protein